MLRRKKGRRLRNWVPRSSPRLEMQLARRIQNTHSAAFRELTISEPEAGNK